MALLVLVGFASVAYADGTVTDVKVVGGSNTVRIEVSASGPVQHRAKALTQPQNQIIVDVFPAKLGSNVKGAMPINKGLVSSASVKQLTDSTVRITVSTVSLPDYKVVTASGSKGLTLSVSTVTMAEGKQATTPAEPVQAAEPVAPKHQPQQPVAHHTPAHQPVKPVQVAQAPRPAAPRMIALTGSGQESSALRRRPAPRRVANRPKLVTLDFVNADLVYVIKILAKEMGRNVYIGPGVEGSVTVTLKSVPVDGALALILKMQENDIAYKLIGYNTLIVAAPEKVNQIEDEILGKQFGPKVRKDAIRQEILLEKAPAAKVIGFLQGQYKDVEFIPHPTMNGFYAVGSRHDILQIKNDVPNLDKVPEVPPPPQREFVQVKYGDLNEVKSLLATLVPDVQMNVDTRQSTLILEGSPGAIEQAKELLDQLDQPLDQVVMECKVVDLTEAGRKNIGVLWTSATGAAGATNITFAENYRGILGFPLSGAGTLSQFGPFEVIGNRDSGIGAFQGAQTLTGAQAFPLDIGTFARTGLVLQANLNFLVTQNEAKVLASPRVAAQSGTEAQIHIGDKFPIVYFDPRAGQFQVNYVDIGIKLDVTANVKKDGYVVCKILPEVSTLVELVNNQYPRTAVRKVTTDARIKDGETLVLGGLIREEDIQAVQKIPLLGDLPILGSLFRNTSFTKTRNEVVIMLTPNIMK
jgi:type II secretory pathway component GspD/PulD (secretin)